MKDNNDTIMADTTKLKSYRFKITAEVDPECSLVKISRSIVTALSTYLDFDEDNITVVSLKWYQDDPSDKYDMSNTVYITLDIDNFHRTTSVHKFEASIHSGLETHSRVFKSIQETSCTEVY